RHKCERSAICGCPLRFERRCPQPQWDPGNNSFLQKGMIVANQGGNISGSDRRYSCNRSAIGFKAKATACQNFFITSVMKIGKAAGEFDFLSVYGNRSIGSLPRCTHCLGYIFDINGKEPANTCVFVFEIACCFCVRGMVNNVGLQLSKYKVQHVEKMDADVGGYTPGLLGVPFPRL